jgi:NAD(P)-dependent dehydrogenase (short-subunit alcohol dehydrogenase family)
MPELRAQSPLGDHPGRRPAAVAGASAGIGAAIARVLGAGGYPVATWTSTPPSPPARPSTARSPTARQARSPWRRTEMADRGELEDFWQSWLDTNRKAQELGD